ncbi:MAG: DUF3159 domain-containing protein [Actinomycetaceae bacterium]|nr:DUF3159 domain-containing protein [Actinomycetaceae bacterium]
MSTTEETAAQAASGPGKGIFSQLDADEFSWSAAVGGKRGMVESILPGLIFVIVYIPTRNLTWTLIAAGLCAVAFCVARLVQRQPITQALSGVIGVVIGIIWAARSGRAENFFIWGLIIGATMGTVLLLSILFRRSAITWAFASAKGLGKQVWTEPQWADLRKRGTLLTWLWAAQFLIRFGVKYPLWAAGMAAELGIVKIFIDTPAFIIAAALTWLGLRRFAHIRRGATSPDDTVR